MHSHKWPSVYTLSYLCRLCLFSIVIAFVRMPQLILHHVLNDSISCQNVTSWCRVVNKSCIHMLHLLWFRRYLKKIKFACNICFRVGSDGFGLSLEVLVQQKTTLL